MKKLSGIVVAIVLTFTTFANAEVREVSKRMEGINPNLIGVLSDEYTDIMVLNTVNILNVEGYRLYTNLSDLQEGANDQLLIGGIMPLLNMGKIGALASMEDNKTETWIQYAQPDFFWGGGINAGDIDEDENDLIVDPGWNWEQGEYNYYEKEGSTETKESGSAYNDLSDKNVRILAGFDIFKIADIGIQINYKIDEIADRNFSYSYSYRGVLADNWDSQVYSSSEEGTSGNAAAGIVPTFNETEISIAPCIKKEISGIELGAALALKTINGKQSKDISSIIKAGKDIADPNALGGTLFDGNLTDDYEREYTLNESLEVKGTGMGLVVDASYPLNDTTKIKAAGSFETNPFSGKGTHKDIDNIKKDGGGAPNPEKQTNEWATDYDREQSVISGICGIEKNVADDMFLGIGLSINIQDTTVEYSETDNETTNVTPAPATVLTYNDSLKLTVKTKVTTISLPVGIEWKATKWLSARIGSNYSIITRDRENELITTDIDVATGNEVKTTTELSSPGFVPKDSQVNFYFGLGINACKNLTIDLAGLTNNTNMVSLHSWELGATLKF